MSRNQKVLAAVVAVLVVVACLAAVWVFVLHGGDAIRWRSDFHIDRLEELSELVTLRVQVSDVLCAEAKGVRAAFLVAGDAVISVDMGLAQVANRDDAARTATLLLPAPAVLNARVDHRRTLTYDVRRRLFTSSRAESRVRDAAMARAQGLIEVAAGSKENIGRARSNAEKTLRLLFKRLGWDVEIAWQGAEEVASR